jgi:hypothetical protein
VAAVVGVVDVAVRQWSVLLFSLLVLDMVVLAVIIVVTHAVLATVEVALLAAVDAVVRGVIA